MTYPRSKTRLTVMELLPLKRSLWFKNVLEADTLYPAGQGHIFLLLSEERRLQPATYPAIMDGQTSFMAGGPGTGLAPRGMQDRVTAECPTAGALIGWKGLPHGPSRAGIWLHRKGAYPRSSWLRSRV